MRPIDCVMDSNSNPTLHALELGSAIGFTKETIIPQKPPPHDNAERWRDAAYSIRHNSQCYSSLPNRPTPGIVGKQEVEPTRNAARCPPTGDSWRCLVTSSSNYCTRWYTSVFQNHFFLAF